MGLSSQFANPTPPGWRRGDPDETHGRLIYRATAERDARMSIGLARKAKIVKVRALVLEWRRVADSILYHQVEETEGRRDLYEYRAKTFDHCADQLEAIVGPADPF